MWRYREPRSYRVVLHDVGHLAETASVVSHALGHSLLCAYGFADRALHELLNTGVDFEAQPPVLCLAVF